MTRWSDLAALAGDPEERHLRLLYRNELRHAVGRNVAAHAHVRDGERKAHRLETTWLPVYDVPATIAPPSRGRLPSGRDRAVHGQAGHSGYRPTRGRSSAPVADGYGSVAGRAAGPDPGAAGTAAGDRTDGDVHRAPVRGPDPGRDRPAHLVCRPRSWQGAGRRSVSPTRRWPCSDGTPPWRRSGKPRA